jgi:hypothetical protein
MIPIVVLNRGPRVFASAGHDILAHRSKVDGVLGRGAVEDGDRNIIRIFWNF